MTEITKEMEREIAELVKNGRLTDDDCLTDEEFEEWTGCKRKSREEITEMNRDHYEIPRRLDVTFTSIGFKMSVSEKTSYLFLRYQVDGAVIEKRRRIPKIETERFFGDTLDFIHDAESNEGGDMVVTMKHAIGLGTPFTLWDKRMTVSADSIESAVNLFEAIGDEEAVKILKSQIA